MGERPCRQRGGDNSSLGRFNGRCPVLPNHSGASDIGATARRFGPAKAEAKRDKVCLALVDQLDFRQRGLAIEFIRPLVTPTGRLPPSAYPSGRRSLPWLLLMGALIEAKERDFFGGLRSFLCKFAQQWL